MAEEVTSSIYRPLKKWQTRLICLEPDTFENPLRCRLFVADIIAAPGFGISELNEIIEYEAISYSWGNAERTVLVICNRQSVLVTPALAEALRHFRLSSEPRWLWCDALCINQEDLVDKAQQVPQMLMIFSKAKAVRAWLGLPGNDAQIRLLDYVQEVELANSEGSDGAPSKEELATALRILVRRPWFSRSWVRQEVFAAASLTLHVGSCCLPWKYFVERVLDGLRDIPSHLMSLHEMSRRRLKAHIPEDSRGPLQIKDAKTYTPFKRRMIAHNNLLVETASLVKNSKYFEASEPRDHVYAMLGMLEDHFGTKQDALQVDYTLSIESVYQNLTKYLINVTGSFEWLAIFRRPGPRSPVASWAIDLRVDSHETFSFETLRERDFRFSERIVNKRKWRYKRQGRIHVFSIPDAMITPYALHQSHRDPDQLYVRGQRLGHVGDIVSEEDQNQHPTLYFHRELSRHVERQLLQGHTKGPQDENESSPPKIVRLIAIREVWLAGSSDRTPGMFICVPPTTRQGDIIFAVDAIRTLFLLRKDESKNGAFHLIGLACFICRWSFEKGTLDGDKVLSSWSEVADEDKLHSFAYNWWDLTQLLKLGGPDVFPFFDPYIQLIQQQRSEDVCLI
jgi:hypothetical protein